MSIGNLHMLMSNITVNIRYQLLSSTSIVSSGESFTLTLNALGKNVPDDTTVGYEIDGINEILPFFEINNPNLFGTSTNDQFGTSVAVSADYAVIGTSFEDDAGGTDSGKVYVYDPETGNLLRTLDNPNTYETSAGDLFGQSVGLSYSYVIVGAPQEKDSDGVQQAGIAYIFNVNTGTLLHTLSRPVISGVERFGQSVAISGSTAIVGSYLENAPELLSGRAYIYNVFTGALLHILDNPNAFGTGDSDYFGWSVAISGTRAIVGAPQEDDANGDISGKAYIFDVSTGALVLTLNNPNPVGTSAGDRFGHSVAISGQYAVVGAYTEDSSTIANIGKVYIYSVTSGSLLHTIDNPNTQAGVNGGFGFSVAISGNTVLIGEAVVPTGVIGKVYLFDAVTGTLLREIQNPDPASGDFFGNSIALSADFVLAGAYLKDDAGGIDSGKAYIFDLKEGDINIPPSDPQFTLVNNTSDLVVETVENDDSIIFVLGETATGKGVYKYRTSKKLSFSVLESTYIETSGTNMGMYFKPDGNKFWLQDAANDQFRQYTMAAAPAVDQWDLNTVTTSPVTGSYGTTGTNHQGMWIDNTGTKLFQVDRDIQTILQDDISAWNPLNPGTPNRNLNISADTSLPSGIAVKQDGTQAFVSSLSPSAIIGYIGTAFQCNTWLKDQTLSLTYNASDVFMDEIGIKMYVSDVSGKVHMYKLATPWKLSTATLLNTWDLSSTFTSISAVYIIEPESEIFRLTLDATDSEGNKTRSVAQDVTITNVTQPGEVYYIGNANVNTQGINIQTTLVVPQGVTLVSAVVVGGGGGGGSGVNKITVGDYPTSGGAGGSGGGLGYGTFAVTPGETLYLQVGAGGLRGDPTTQGNGRGDAGFAGGTSFIKRGSLTGTSLLEATGGGGGSSYLSITTRIAGSFSGTEVEGGGDGGLGGEHVNSVGFDNDAGGGGGAGGYSGAGGQGESANGTVPDTNGAGGAGAGGARDDFPGAGRGGGVGIFRSGSDGIAPSGHGSTTLSIYPGYGGGGGSGWNSSTIPETRFGRYGGHGGPGAIRIIWGKATFPREYPSLYTLDFFT